VASALNEVHAGGGGEPGRGVHGLGVHRLGARGRLGLAALAIAGLLLGAGVALDAPGDARGAGDEARILMGAPSTLDPAASGDAGSSLVIAQLYETLTAVDATLTVRPALARSWEILDGGRRIVFHLRPNLTFSDGSPLTASDVVRSWLRVIDPDRPSPLASLMLDVVGARDYLAGRTGDAADVGIRAAGETVEVDLVRAAADFPSVVACTTFAVVPEDLPPDVVGAARDFVGSGGYVLDGIEADRLVLQANERYWAGRPAIGTIQLVNDLGGRSTVAAYEAGDLDYTPVSSIDAPWIRYDETLGPDLREETAPVVSYLAFDTGEPPFDDVRVRQAIGAAVDWRRIVRLGDAGEVATGLVPPGIPGRSETDFLPLHDPDRARSLLADAGYPGGRGFPETAIVSTGGGYIGAILADVRRELGIDIRFEAVDFDVLTTQLDTDPPAAWTLAWVADYPGANDFLGVLLRSGESNNHGGWSSPDFDAALERALSATTGEEATAGFDDAQEIMRRDVPLVPLAYDQSWSLSRAGLLGALPDGLGNLRLAGLAWAAGS
jgi:ABC-type transport system substrate-binding protein